MKKDSNQTQLTPLETALQTQFKPSANVVREAFKIVEGSRRTFAVNAVRFGLCALAAKPIVGHGNFGKWLSDSLSENGNPRPSAERTARDYIGLAKVFVQKLRHPNKLSDALAAGVGEFCEFCNIDRDKFDIEKILADKNLTEDLLRRTLSGMTLPQLRNLLREGAVQADEDKKAEDTAAKTLTKRDLKGLGGNGDGQQLDFFSELYNDFRATIEAPRSDRRFSEMPRAEMEQLGNYLIAQGREIVEIAKGKKD